MIPLLNGAAGFTDEARVQGLGASCNASLSESTDRDGPGGGGGNKRGISSKLEVHG